MTAVPRVEWRCPGCQKRFAIRADMPLPDVCPKCAGTAAAGASPGDAAAGVSSERDRETWTPLTSPFEAPSPPAVSTGAVSLMNLRPRYPALRLLSLFYKIFAVLTLLGAVAALLMSGLSAFRIEDPAARSAAVVLYLTTFGGTLLGGMTLFAIGELIQLAIDVEFNTRRRQAL